MQFLVSEINLRDVAPVWFDFISHFYGNANNLSNKLSGGRNFSLFAALFSYFGVGAFGIELRVLSSTIS
jgi:hypothetical protein